MRRLPRDRGQARQQPSARPSELFHDWTRENRDQLRAFLELHPGTHNLKELDGTVKSARTADQLRAFLSHPHGAMPDLSLTRAEINDLVAYIETLR